MQMRDIEYLEIAMIKEDYASQFIDNQFRRRFVPAYILHDGDLAMIFLIKHDKIFYA